MELEDRLVISGGITERHGMAVRATSHAVYISITAAAAANIVMTAGTNTSVSCTARSVERILGKRIIARHLNYCNKADINSSL